MRPARRSVVLSRRDREGEAMRKVVFSLALATAAALGASETRAQPARTAVTASGPVVGKAQGAVTAYLGIPFARPPIGDLRWAPPQPPAPWTAPREATHFGDACVQTLAPQGRSVWTTEFMTQSKASEDCLFLNVWTAARRGAQQPVLVFYHGGAFTEGAGDVAVYDGARNAAKGVIVVTVNYRLGALGFMAHPALTAEQGGASGNYALQDAIAALNWVKANIAAFGGDPDKVTIAGQSAGASMVTSLMDSPKAKGLFRAAIVVSGGGGARPSLAQAEKAGLDLQAELKASSLPELRKIPAERFLGRRAGPITDGRYLVAAPDAGSKVVLMRGATANDSGPNPEVRAADFRASAGQRYAAKADAFLKLYPATDDAQAGRSSLREIQDRALLGIAGDTDARRAGGGVSKAYLYLFSHVLAGPTAAKVGAFHTSDLVFDFDNLALAPNRAITPTDRKVAAIASGYWVNFIKTGDPNGPGLPRWPAYGADRRILDVSDDPKARPYVAGGSAALLQGGQAPPLPPRG